VAPLELSPFRFRDPASGKWLRARYVATLADVSSRYREWEIIGPTEIRGDEPAKMLTPHRPMVEVADVSADVAQTIDSIERDLLRVFLRRHVTCARRRRWAQLQGGRFYMPNVERSRRSS
jgi:hypothetical protein